METMSSWKRTFYAAWVAQIFSITGFSFVLPFMPDYIRTLGVQGEASIARWAGLVSAATALTMAVFAPIWGHLADRYGRKRMVLRSMFGGAVVLGLMGFCRTVEELLLCRILQGVLTGTVAASLALVASVTPRERSGYALGMMHAAVHIGICVGPYLGGWVADHFGFLATFLSAGVLLLVGGLLIKFCTVERFELSLSLGKPDPGTYGDVLRVAGYLAAAFALFTISFGSSAPGPVYLLFVEKLRGSSERIKTVTGLLFSVGGLATALSAGFLSRLGDRWGYKRLLVLTSLCAAAVSVSRAMAQSVAHLFVLQILMGLGAGGMMPAINSIIRNIIEEKHLGKAYGVTSSVSSLGMAIGPLAGGYLGASLGLRFPFILTGTVLALAAALVGWRVRGDGPARSAANAE